MTHRYILGESCSQFDSPPLVYLLAGVAAPRRGVPAAVWREATPARRPPRRARRSGVVSGQPTRLAALGSPRV